MVDEKLVPKLRFKVYSNYYKLKNIDFSIKIFYIGIIVIIIINLCILYLNSKLVIFNDTNNLITNTISLTIGMTSFLIAIVSLFWTKEMIIYGIVYEKRKNSLIRFHGLIQHNLLSIPQDMRLKFINMLLKNDIYSEEIHNTITELEKDRIICFNGKRLTFDNMKLFRENYELYYLPEHLIFELNYYLKDKKEITDKNIIEMLELIETYTYKEFKIEIGSFFRKRNY